MTRFELLKWRELSPADRAAWTAFRAARPELRSPYFDPAFLDVVDHVRGDLQVLRAYRFAEPVAFLPLHRHLLGGAEPAAGPLSDRHGFVGAPECDFDPAEALEAVGVSSFRFDAGVGLAGAATQTHVLDLRGGYETFRARRKAAAGKAWRSLASRERRLAEAGVRVTLVEDDRSPETLRTLLAWKSAQYRRTHQFDLFSRRWISELVGQLSVTRQGDFRGRVSSLWIGDRLAAAHFGMQSGRVLHYWFPAYDVALHEHAPGLMLLTRLAEAVARECIDEIDLGKGDYRFKREFADPGDVSTEGAILTSNLGGQIRSAAHAVGEAWAGLPLGLAAQLPGKAMRRIRRDAGYLAFGA